MNRKRVVLRGPILDAVQVSSYDYDEVCEILRWANGELPRPEERENDPKLLFYVDDFRWSEREPVYDTDWIVMDVHGRVTASTADEFPGRYVILS